MEAGKDVYFKPEYGKLYEQQEGGELRNFLYQCDYGEVSYIFLYRQILDSTGIQGYYDITTPYGYGGPVVIYCENNKRTDLIGGFYKDFSTYCADNNIVSEFIRFHPLEENNKDFLEYCPAYYSYNIVCDLKPDIDTIWRNFEHKVRKNVNRAKSYQLQCFSENTGDSLKDFLKIYYGTMDRRNAKEYYYFDKLFFERLIKTCRGNFRFFYVIFNNRVVSTELTLLGDTGIIHSFLGGTEQEAYSLRANDFLKWNIILWAKENGFTQFLLGGGVLPEDGIYKYKYSFAPNGVIEFYLGKKIRNKAVYDALVHNGILEGTVMEKTEFFPQYRAIKN